MATEVLMPKLGLTMQEGTITGWVVASGATVSAGTVVMTIETDKVEAEVEAAADGVLMYAAGVGDTLECGELVGWLLAEGEDPPAATSSDGRILASPKARRLAVEAGIDLAGVSGTGPGGRITSEDLAGMPASAPANAGIQRFVPHVAQSLAAKLGVDIATLIGTGPAGRVTRTDVYAAAGNATRSSGTSPNAARSGPRPGQRVPLTGMRGVIAERMASSLAETAQLSLFMDVNMDRVVAMRDEMRAIGVEELGAIPGFTDFVVAAVARALREHPIVNSSLVGAEVVLHEEVHVGVAVALDDGLVVPVVRHADLLPLPDLALETSRLAAAARTRGLELAELEGGTIAVTALGMFGVDGFTPIINQPNTAIVGVGRIRDETTWASGQPERSQTLTLSLTWDHRAFDGAPAAQFAAAIKRQLESPLRLLA
jgi:pyruvate dehydrogenase E2 component (dihydrolipoamide acetyltransferase)